MKMNQRSVMAKVYDVAEKFSNTEYPDYRNEHLVAISGLNNHSKKILLNRDLIVRHFPFKIGRISCRNPFSSMKQDFVITDEKPFRISKRHLSIEVYDKQIYLADEESRLGSIVNGTPMGRNAGGKREIALRYGKNEVVLGGSSSPIIFQMEVKKNDEPAIFDDYVRCGDQLIPVASLYMRLCHHTKIILSSRHINLPDRIGMALDLIAGITESSEAIELLYCYSAHPDVFSDVIVAHSVNTAVYAIKLALNLSYSKETAIKIGAAALFHDIGMYSIPREIVYKKEVISNEEFEIMKKHTGVGYEELFEVHDDNKLIPATALEHHERIDGNGYPNGIKTISEIIELLGIVDFYEAVTHQRPQRGPITPHEAVKMLLHLKYGVFSQKMLKTFVNVFSLFPAYSVVRLSSGEIGQVVKMNVNSPLKPVVRLFFDSNGQTVGKRKDVDLSNERHLFISKDISDRIFIDNYFKV